MKRKPEMSPSPRKCAMEHYFEQRGQGTVSASDMDDIWETMFRKYKTYSAYLASSDSEQRIEPKLFSTVSTHKKMNNLYTASLKSVDKTVASNSLATLTELALNPGREPRNDIRRQLVTPQKLNVRPTTSSICKVVYYLFWKY